MTSSAHAPIPGPMAYTPEWHALRLYDPDRKERPVVFGASQASKAIENPLELYLLTTGMLLPDDPTEEMEVGLLMEPVVLEMYRRRSGNEFYVGVPTHFHPEHNFMSATPDAIGLPSTPDTCERWGIDAKTSSDRMLLSKTAAEDERKYGEAGTDAVPSYVLWQTQQQCAVFGFPYVDVPVLFGRRYSLYRVPRDETLIGALVAAEKELAERILNNDPPAPNWSLPETRKCLQALYGVAKGTTIALSDDRAERWNAVCRRKALIKEFEAENEIDINRILDEMQTAEFAQLPSGEKELRRSVIAESFYTQADVQALAEKVGQIKRKSHHRLTERKVK